ncbi:hypothetical protein OKW49_002383 [Paraburkholderia youngii]|uniref:hypothetical protein n=1 Tax=Paraburkholderia youngii TaxID=2782701 RepID=UPI003D201C7A
MRHPAAPRALDAATEALWQKGLAPVGRRAEDVATEQAVLPDGSERDTVPAG